MEKSEPGKYSCFCNSGIVFITGPTPLVGSLLKTARSCWISHHLIGSDLDWINDQPQIWVDSDCIIQKWGSFWQKPPGPTSDFFHVMMSMSTSGSNHLEKPINYGGWGYGGHWPSAWCLKKSCLEWCISQKHTDRANREIPNEKRLPEKNLV